MCDIIDLTQFFSEVRYEVQEVVDAGGIYRDLGDIHCDRYLSQRAYHRGQLDD